MNRKLVSGLSFAAMAAAAAVAAMLTPPPAIADDITMDTTPFVSTRARADVQAELLQQPGSVSTATSESKLQVNEAAYFKSAITPQQRQQEYAASRQQVHALSSEDSGSSYLKMTPPYAGDPTRVMGAPPQ
jgi:hypothetical protein